jgi:thioredoxin reductase
MHDPFSIAGKTLPVSEQAELLVIGAGPAGLAAAIEAARLGGRVVLADENPVPAATMGDDIPLLFGQRFSGAARNATAMTEALIATEPRLAEAFEAGVDVRLGTQCWGLYANGASVGWLPGPVAGLADMERAWLLQFQRAIVATGWRDMGLAFPGWELPGVMGAAAAWRLATRYQAFEARRAVLVGSTAEAVAAAEALRGAGVEIAAVVEREAAPVADTGGLPLLVSHGVVRAEGRDGVTALTVAGPDGAQHAIECDTIVLGVGAVPVVELLDAAGCRTAFDGCRGGWVPVLNAARRTSVPCIQAVGDCAGVWAAKTRDPRIAEAEGIAAARDEPAAQGGGGGGADVAAYRLGWVRDTVIGGDEQTNVCRCEEVTARDILEVRPPRYLGAPPDRRNDRSLVSLLGGGPPSPDQVKRLTRAGMGVCQGRRCREQVACLLALGADADLSRVPLATYRAPVRPLPLKLLGGAAAEPAALAAGWDSWFGISQQSVPYWEIAGGE